MQASRTWHRHDHRLLARNGSALAMVAALAVAEAAFAQLPPVLEVPLPELISTADGKRAGDGRSAAPRITPDGAIVAFESDATDLAPGDDDSITDIYIREQSTGVLVPVTVGIVGAGGKKDRSFAPSLSGLLLDPRGGDAGVLCAFTSLSTVLSPIDRDPGPDVYLAEVRARQPAVRLVSAGFDERGEIAPGNSVSDQPEISLDGEVIVFRSRAGNLAEPFRFQPLEFSHVHIHFIANNSTVRLDALPGARMDGDSSEPDVSLGGRIVVFTTEATGLVPEDGDKGADVVAFDPQRGYRLVSVDSAGKKLPGPSRLPRVDAKAERIAFISTDPAGVDQVMVRDEAQGTTEIASLDFLGRPAGADCMIGDISPDGRVIVFTSAAGLTPDDVNGSPDTYLRDLESRRTLLLSRSARTLLAAGRSPMAPFSASVTDLLLNRQNEDVLREAVFSSAAADIAPPGADANGEEDVFAAPLRRRDAEEAFHPPSNAVFLFHDGSQAVVARSLDGKPAAPPIRIEGAFGGLAVDGANVLWLLDGALLRRFEVLCADPDACEVRPLDEMDVPVGGDGDRIHALIAFGGAAFIAAEVGGAQWLFRASPGAQPTVMRAQVFPAGVPVAGMNLAPAPGGGLWLGAQVDGRRYDIFRFDADLEGLRRFSRVFEADRPGELYHLLAVDAAGQLLLRSRIELARISANGNLAWKRFLAPGDGLAVDGAGNAIVLAGREVLVFSPAGKLLLAAAVDDRIPVDDPGPGRGGRRIHLALDGDHSVWLLSQGSGFVQRIKRPLTGEAPPGDAVSEVFDLENDPLGDQLASDSSGFIAANVSAQDADSDRDSFPNRREVIRFDNPFDSTAPPSRLPPLGALTATVAGNAVDLRWSATTSFCEYVIIRDRRQIFRGPVAECAPGTPGEFCYRDASPHGGVNRYVVFGVGDCGQGGAGAGAALEGDRRGGGAGPTPSSDPVETSATIGEGEVADSSDIIQSLHGADPTAVAVLEKPGEDPVVLAAVLDTLVKFTISGGALVFDDEIPLPVDPFATATITGLEFDPGDETGIFVLLADGRFFRLTLGDDASPAASAFDLDDTLAGTPPGFDSHEYYGLAARGGDLFTVQNSISFSVSEPGFECLIGFKPSTGVESARRVLSGGGGVFACRDTGWAGGVASTPEGGLLAGLGAATSTIDEVSAVDVADAGGGVLVLSAGDSSLALDVDLYTEVLDFSYVDDGGEELLVVAATGGTVALIDAAFPPVQQVAFEPERARWDEDVDLELTVSYGGTGKTFEDLAMAVFVDGAESELLEPPAVDAVASEAVLRVSLAAVPHSTRKATVSVRSTEGSFTCEVILGFLRGDANNDGEIDISDGILILIYLFVGGGAVPPCLDAANLDDAVDSITGENEIDISDAIALFGYLFMAGPPPSSPFGEPGLDKTADETVECVE